jgi:hypothetical protein
MQIFGKENEWRFTKAKKSQTISVKRHEKEIKEWFPMVLGIHANWLWSCDLKKMFV